jgi:glycosyltransferase involved in cell wall biosynthesis
MTEFVKQDVSGLLFEPGNAKDLANQVRLLWGQPQRCIELGRAGRVWAQHEYAPESYYPRLMEICRSAILEKNRQSLSATSAWTGPAPRLSSSHAACPKAEPNRADRHSLRFLMVHNEYGKRSGEEVEFDCIRNLVEVRGHLTCSFLRSSKSVDQMLLGRERAFFSGLYSWRSRRDIGTALRQFDPDIVLVQNLYPWISPAVLPLCRRSRAGVVMLVANYRLMCPSGLHLRRGQICERCLGGREYQCAIRNCEEGLFKSLGYALRSAVARRAGWYKDSVSAYICASTFLKIRMIDAGFEERKLHVVPNVVLDVDYRPAPEGQLGEYVGYVGRLSREKGVSVLLEAARLCPDIPFALAGDCSPAFRLPEPLPPNVRLAGFISGTQLDEFYRNARLVVNSSQCFETFGMSIAEAMLHGKAVIASRLGVMPEFVRENLTGLLAEPGNPADLAARIGQLWSQPARCMELGRAGRTWALQEYSPQRYYSRFIEVCRGAILEKGGDVVGFDRMLREIGA